MIAAVVGLSAAPAFAATSSNNAQPANRPMQQEQYQENWNTSGGAGAQPEAYEHQEREFVLRGDRATKALNMLEANGFTHFTNFHRMHNGLFGASVDRNGRWRSVQIDPSDNQIMRG